MTWLATHFTTSAEITNHIHLIPQSIAISAIVLSSISNSSIHFDFRFRLKIIFENLQLVLLLLQVKILENRLICSVLSRDTRFKLGFEVIWSLAEIILSDIRFCNDHPKCTLNCIVCIVFLLNSANRLL